MRLLCTECGWSGHADELVDDNQCPKCGYPFILTEKPKGKLIVIVDDRVITVHKLLNAIRSSDMDVKVCGR